MFDASLKIDLTVHVNRSQLISFLTDAQVSVVVLTPTPYTQTDGNPLNCWYQTSVGEEQYLTQTCGHIAAQQLNSGLHFLFYQATSSTQ